MTEQPLVPERVFLQELEAAQRGTSARRRVSKISDTDVEEMLFMRAEGARIHEIADFMGCCPSTVVYWLSHPYSRTIRVRERRCRSEIDGKEVA